MRKLRLRCETIETMTLTGFHDQFSIFSFLLSGNKWQHVFEVALPKGFDSNVLFPWAFSAECIDKQKNEW